MSRQVRRIVKSFSFAFAGLAYLLRTQANFWVHLLAAGMVVVLGALLGVAGGEWAALVLAIGLVLVAEATNSALEALVDLASPDHHPLARAAKDLGAAAVLLAAGCAALVGLIVLLPRLLALLAPS
jgi:diacylglycerol kinase